MTSKDAKVTIVIPCYNDGEHLQESVRSALAQSSRDFRIIIVDDASTDRRTVDCLHTLSSDDRIEVIRLQQNRGTAHARNTGISASASPYILTLDADDLFDPSFLEKALAAMETDPKVGVVTCGVQEFGLHSGYWLPKGGGVENFLVENNCCGNALFRRAFWEDAGGYDTGILYEDWDFWISGTSKGWHVHVLQEPLFFYRRTGKSKSASDGPQKAEIYRLMVRKHRDCYCAHIEEVLFQKERQLLGQYYSPSYQKYLRLVTLLVNVKHSLFKALRKRKA